MNLVKRTIGGSYDFITAYDLTRCNTIVCCIYFIHCVRRFVILMEDSLKQRTLDRAWRMYCDDTAGGMDVRDFWDELPRRLQDYYFYKALKEVTDEL